MKSKVMASCIVALSAVILLGCPNPVSFPTDTTINSAAISGVTVPAFGATPVSSITETAQYTGSVVWNPSVSGTFAANTVYTATITLTAKAGYTLGGVQADFFTVAGATSVSHSANSGVVTAVFPATGAAPDTVINLTMIPGVSAPVVGGTPITSLDTSQYTGMVSWNPTVSGTFAASTTYTATITVSPKAGFTLTGVAVNSFTVDGATSVTHSANSGVVTVVFPSTAAATINLLAIPGVTAPVLGATPVTSIDSSQYTGTVSWNPMVSGTFAASTTYTATITVSPKAGFTLTGVAVNSFMVDGAISVTHSANSGVVTAVFPSTAAATINLLAIPGVTAPVLGATPVTSIDTSQYTGTVSWSPTVSGTFAASTTYTATITLSPKADFTLTGIAANNFTVDGATSVAHSANSGVVTAVFPSTAAATVNLLAIPGVTTPVLGGTPVTSIDTSQYTGTVSWSPSVSGTFAHSTTYTATITLSPKSGYTLTGVNANTFSVLDATSVTHSANSGVVTAVFPSTATTISVKAIPGVTAPVTGATPITVITETPQYTGTVAWNGTPKTFGASTVYTATITLIAKADFTLDGVAANYFTVAGASATNAVNSGVVTAVFPATSSLGVTMVNVAGGTFNNGTASMTVSSFRISQHEITRAQFAAIMGTDPSSATYSNNTTDPVQNINWYHAIAFCNKLSLAEGLSPVYAVTGVNFSTLAYESIPTADDPIWNNATATWTNNGYRLPTEAEWEFAARGGNSSNNYTYAGSNTIDNVAWYASNSGNTTHAVGTKAANELGLYDMSGNVREWCWDWNGNYPTTAQTDYRGPVSGVLRVSRGGTFNSHSSASAVAARDYGIPSTQIYWSGFRVVRFAPAATINLKAIPGVTAPVLGGTPVTSIDSSQYTGTVSWSPSVSGTFAHSTTYTATITLSPKSGYTLTGVTANFFTVAGASSSANSANSGVVTAVFPTTGDGSYTSPNIGVLRYVPAGRFQRDATVSNISVITKPYRISQHEITRAQFLAVMGTDPSNTTYSSGTTDPVQMTNWYHAIAFCNKLSLAEGLSPVYAITGVNFGTLAYASIPTTYDVTWNSVTANWTNNGYRLPTEMEWLWAAMGAPVDGRGSVANTTGYLKAFAGSTGSNAIGSYTVFGFNGVEIGRTTTARSNSVGSKAPNELGLYDMSGNVWEWTWDLYAAYPSGTLSDYRGAASGATMRIYRGGGWSDYASYCAIAVRDYGNPNSPGAGIGFRVVRP